MRADASAVERLRDDLRMLLIAIRLARPEIDAANMPAARRPRLTVLLKMLERRIEALADRGPAGGRRPQRPCAGPPPARAAGIARHAACQSRRDAAASRRAGIADPLADQRASAGDYARA